MYLSNIFIKKLFSLGFLLTIVLVLFDLLTYFYYPKTTLAQIFLATREQTPLTWVSSVTLLFIAMACATVYLKKKTWDWYFLTLAFIYFSIDDAVYLHERLSGAIQEMIPLLNEFPGYSWVIIYLPLLAFALGMLILKLWEKSSKKTKKLILLASFGLFLSLGLDLLDGWVGKNEIVVFCIDPMCDKGITHILRLLEEVVEVYSFGIFAYLLINKYSRLD